MSRTVVVALLFLKLLMLQAQWVAPGELKPYSPGGDYVLIGDRLLLECRLNETGPYNSTELFIEKGDDFNGTATILDRWAILMNNTVTSFNYSGTYFCWVGSNVLVGSQEVQVEYQPKAPVNLTCVYYNWDKGLRCTWELGVDYVDVSNINVLCYYLPFGEKIPNMCPNQTRTSTYWDRNFYPGISIILFVNNTRANVLTKGDQVNLRLLDLVKPDPVQFFHATKTSESITVFWSHNRPIRSKVYRLQFRHDDSQIWKEALIPSIVLPIKKEDSPLNYTLENLHPYTEYEIQMDVRPTLTTGYWSEVLIRKVTTAEDYPTAGPTVTPGSYYQQPCSQGYTRDVTVYWQEPEKEFQNGIITGYNLYNRDINITVEATRFQYTFRTLSCDTSDEVLLYAQTSIGPSLNYSQIIVPAGSQSASIFEDFYILLYDTYEVRAEWRVPESYQGEISQYYVYWCHGSKVLQTCETKLQWLQVAGNQTTALLPVSSLQVDSLLFGISSTVEGNSSGILWAKCIVKNISPTHSPRGLQVVKTSSKTTLKVKWPNSRCLDDDRALITEYRVFVAHVVNGKVGMKKNYTYNLTRNEHSEQDLQINGNYSFQIQALSNAGHGPLSAAVYMAIPSDSVNQAHTLEVIIPIVVIGLLAIVVVCLVGCNKERLKKEFKKIEITLPKMQSPTREPLQQQISSSSLEEGTERTAATEDYIIVSSSEDTFTGNSPNSSIGIPYSPNECNPGQNTTICMVDPDTIQVMTVTPSDSAVTQGNQPCSPYLKLEELNNQNQDYSLFAKSAAVDQVQHPDYASPEAAQSQMMPVSERQVPVPSRQACIGAQNINLDYVQSTDLNLPPPVTGPVTTVMHDDYVQAGLVNGSGSGSSSDTGPSTGSDSSRTSDSVQSYVKADVGGSTYSPSSTAEQPTGPAVLELEIPSPKCVDPSGYVKYSDLPPVTITKL